MITLTAFCTVEWSQAGGKKAEQRQPWDWLQNTNTLTDCRATIRWSCQCQWHPLFPALHVHAMQPWATSLMLAVEVFQVSLWLMYDRAGNSVEVGVSVDRKKVIICNIWEENHQSKRKFRQEKATFAKIHADLSLYLL